jgi:hypothetical protein
MTDNQTRTVELAYPLDYDGTRYEPDATVTLPADKARQLVTDGRARWPRQPVTATTQPAPTTTEQGATPAAEGSDQ